MLEICRSLKRVPSFIHSTNAVAVTCLMSKPCFQQGCCAGVHDSICTGSYSSAGEILGRAV